MIFFLIMNGSIDLHDTQEAYLTTSVMRGTDWIEGRKLEGREAEKHRLFSIGSSSLNYP